MSENDVPNWLRWAREIQAISQIGLHFSKNHHDEINFSRLKEIAAEMTEAHSNLDQATARIMFQEQVGYATVKVDVRGASSKMKRSCWSRSARMESGACPGGGPMWGDAF
jgi:primase-polymerase (primpol)-like protein